MQLVEFLRARLDEDEQAANVRVKNWIFRPEISGDELVDADECVVLSGTYVAHAARHDPNTVLADVAAKRRIIKLAEVALEARNVGLSEKMFMDFVLKNLAWRYADHPDYRQEWRPIA